MTGGVTFLLDEGDRVTPRVNFEIVEVCSITTAEQESMLKGLLEAIWRRLAAARPQPCWRTGMRQRAASSSWFRRVNGL